MAETQKCSCLVLVISVQATHYLATSQTRNRTRSLSRHVTQSHMEWRAIATFQSQRFLEVLRNVGHAIAELVLMAMVFASQENFSGDFVNAKEQLSGFVFLELNNNSLEFILVSITEMRSGLW